MMRQYLDIKEKHQDSILFFRLGDFYEMFFDDAVEASKILEITLTTRNKNDSNPVPLCGIPHHSASGYIAKLIESGKKVAICDQVEDPKTAKGVVKREVTRVVTPGLVVDESNLKSRESNYLAAIAKEDGQWGLSYLDLSTGDFRVTELVERENKGGDLLADELLKIGAKEIVIDETLKEDPHLSETLALLGASLSWKDEFSFDFDDCKSAILEQFRLNSLDGIGCVDMKAGICAAGAVLAYLKETQGGSAGHIDRLKPYSTSSYLLIDSATHRNLELTSTMIDEKKKGSLFHTLDFTETAMGGRKLREWINYPLQDIGEINDRLDAIADLKEMSSIRNELKEALNGVYDLERLNGRVSVGRANPRDMAALGASIARLPGLKSILADIPAALIQGLSSKIDTMAGLEDLISRAIVDEPPISLKEGGIIREGFCAELDELRNISREGKGYLARLEAKEKERTGISSLKIRYNKVFGYYLEVTKTNLHLVPEDYIRKQTLSNAERFITPELKEYETKILGADEKIGAMEHDLFVDLREEGATYSARMRDTSEALAAVDVLLSLAQAADRYSYCRPLVNDSEKLSISHGRHPVVEMLNPDEAFVPNDTDMDCDESQLIIITGPNMAGKSTYIRQVALITLMAHMGSFIPAESAEIGLTDRIFTRVGASDNLARGQSTFMVEMNESANILNNATKRSLIILDEIGRGTSTFDGVSIAWAVAEHIHDSPGLGSRTLFATHYHELTELSLTLKRVKNYNVAVREWNDRIIFLRKIVEGGASRSYGIEVARLAGLPSEVIKRSLEILGNLESGEFDEAGMPKIAIPKKQKKSAAGADNKQMSLFVHPADHLLEEIRKMDIAGMTPLDALNRLSRLKEEFK